MERVKLEFDERTFKTSPSRFNSTSLPERLDEIFKSLKAFTVALPGSSIVHLVLVVIPISRSVDVNFKSES